MSQRHSVYVEGFGHTNPIPAACRVGNVLMSGSIRGLDVATGRLPPTIDEQCACMFANVRRIVEAAGGTTGDIVKITVWLRDPSDRHALNHEWLAMFPDPASRPARHTLRGDLEGDKLVECDVTAVIATQGAATG
jgi:2-iminobutanoate/2-iminopropanoate deaminase